MSPIVNVEPLARHRALTSLIARWFIAEWPGWYGADGERNATLDLKEFASSEDTLPVGMVMFENGTPVGAGALKTQSIPSHRHLYPWAAAGYIQPSCRGRGLGALLLQALVVKAKALGFERVYCATSTAERLLVRSGWQAIESTLHEGNQLTVFQIAT
jgi:GNAT superfamily N-acetyltransferase